MDNTTVCGSAASGFPQQAREPNGSWDHVTASVWVAARWFDARLSRSGRTSGAAVEEGGGERRGGGEDGILTMTGMVEALHRICLTRRYLS